MTYIKFSLKLLKKNQLWKGPGGRKRANDNLVKFYLACRYYCYAGRRPINRRSKRAICKVLGISPKTFWRKLKTLRAIGLSGNFKLAIPYLPEKGKNRRSVWQHRYTYCLAGKYILIPFSKDILKPDYNIRGLIETTWRDNSHPAEKIAMPDISETSENRMKNKHIASFVIPKLRRDTATEVEVSTTDAQVCQRVDAESLVLTLIHATAKDKKVQIQKVHWSKGRIIRKDGVTYLASGGLLYQKLRKRVWQKGIISTQEEKKRVEPAFFIPNGGTKYVPQVSRAELLKAQADRANLMGWGQQASAEMYKKLGLKPPGGSKQ